MCLDGGRELRFEIGGIVLSLGLRDGEDSLRIAEPYPSFLSEKSPEASFGLKRGPLPDLSPLEEVFDSGGPWKLYRRRQAWCVALHAPALGPEPYQIAEMENDFGKGEIHTRDDVPDHGLGACGLGRPLMEVLYVNLLSRGRGVLLHACAVRDNGRGFLFAGTSGAGKSTMANLWKGCSGTVILSDDRVIVREADGHFWAYGTPWHGDVDTCSPQKVRIDQAFVLRHGTGNSIIRLEAPNALTSLFVRSFPTYWYPKGMDFTLGFLGRVTKAVPCHELAFLPDPTTIDFVRDWSDTRLGASSTN